MCLAAIDPVIFWSASECINTNQTTKYLQLCSLIFSLGDLQRAPKLSDKELLNFGRSCEVSVRSSVLIQKPFLFKRK